MTFKTATETHLLPGRGPRDTTIETQVVSSFTVTSYSTLSSYMYERIWERRRLVDDIDF